MAHAHSNAADRTYRHDERHLCALQGGGKGSFVFEVPRQDLNAECSNALCSILGCTRRYSDNVNDEAAIAAMRGYRTQIKRSGKIAELWYTPVHSHTSLVIVLT